MAVTTQTVVLEFDAKTGEVMKATGQLQKSMEDVADAAQDAADSTEDIGKQAKKAGSDMKKAGKTGATGFKLVGTAIKATGIGLLVGIIAKLIAKFTENKKVAEALEAAFAGIGAVMNILIDAAAPLGDLLIDLFTNPQETIQKLKDKLTDLFGSPKEALMNFANLLKENIVNRFEGIFKLIPRLASAIGKLFKGDFSGAAKTAADAVGQVVLGVENVTDKVAEAASAVVEFAAPFVKSAKEAIAASTLLTQKQQALRDAQRELNVATAQGAAEVEELKRQSDDQRLSIEQRIDAATRAAELNKKFADENVAIANETAALLRQELKLQGETEERLQAVAEAEIAAAAAAQASSTIQTELQNKLYALNQELIAQEEERLAVEAEARLAMEERLAEEQKLKDEAAAADAQRRKEELEAELATAEAIKQAKLDIAKSSLDALAALNQAFTGESEEQQKKGFERSKKIQTAQALISTYESAVQAFKSLAGIPVVGPGLGAAAAAAATAAGLANVKQIQSQQYQSASAGGGGAGYSSAGSAAAAVQQAPTAPTLDLGFLGEGSQQQVIETYVISENVTNAQQANKKIQDQATL